MAPRLYRITALTILLLAAATLGRAQAPSGTPHSATVQWTAPSPVGGSGTVKCYNVYRSAVPVSTYAKLTTPCIAGTSFTDSTAPNGSTQSYVATTVDTANNESAASNAIQGTIPTNPNPPTAPTITLAQLTPNTNGTETALVKFTDAPNQYEVVLFFDGAQRLLGQRLIAASAVSSFAQSLTVPAGTGVTATVCNSLGACSSQQAM